MAQINALGVDAVIVNGDVSADDRFEEEQTARQIIDGLDAPWHVARGNHDRAGQGEADPRCGPDDDCFRTVFFPDTAASATPPTRLFESFEVAGHRFVLLDSNDAAGVGDLTDPQQNAFLREELARHADQRTFVFFHHPVAQFSTALALPPVIFGVASRRARGSRSSSRRSATRRRWSGVRRPHPPQLRRVRA